MSLKGKWEEYRCNQLAGVNDEAVLVAIQRAFYDGAETVLRESATPYTLEMHVRMSNFEDEIDHFKAGKP